uniref:Uncharacterized protein n=1 Tax=Amphimedon queenslandica TaxID=400682 RepID=A0A1X7T976_AMPQE
MSPVLYKLSPYQFTHEHMHNLLHGAMIDAEVIDFYLKLLLEKHQDSHFATLPSHVFDYSNFDADEIEEFSDITVIDNFPDRKACSQQSDGTSCGVFVCKDNNDSYNIRKEIAIDIAEKFIGNDNGINCNKCGIVYPQNQAAIHSKGCECFVLKHQSREAEILEMNFSLMPKEK